MRLLWISAFLVLLDQTTKMLVRGFSIPAFNIYFDGIPLGSTRQVLGDFLRLTHIENYGMAFGIDLGAKLFFSIFSVVASIAILIYFVKMRDGSFSFQLSLVMILGGAFGNLIDRVFYGVLFNYAPLFYGRVVDFIDVDFFDVTIFGYHLTRWPVFNVADASVTLGVILLLFAHKTVKEEASPPEAARTASVSGGKDGESPDHSILPTEERVSAPAPPRETGQVVRADHSESSPHPPQS